MAYSVLIPQSIQAKDNDALNKSAIGTIAVAGGGLVSATPSSTAGDDRWTIATPTTTTLTGLEDLSSATAATINQLREAMMLQSI